MATEFLSPAQVIFGSIRVFISIFSAYFTWLLTNELHKISSYLTNLKRKKISFDNVLTKSEKSKMAAMKIQEGQLVLLN